MNRTKLTLAAAMAAAILVAGGGLPGTASAATAAKPVAGCLLKSGAKAAIGTQVGTWECVGSRWHKVAAIKHAPFFADAWKMKAKA
jgi:hypothetical protein